MVGENLINENLINPSELDLLQYTNKTIDLPLFLEVRGQFLDCGEFVKLSFTCSGDFPGGSDSKVSAYNAEDPGSIPGLGRSPGEGNGNPLQCSCLENPMDGGAWWATVHGATKSQT